MTNSLQRFLKKASEETSKDLELKEGDFIFLLLKDAQSPIEGSFCYMDDDYIALHIFEGSKDKSYQQQFAEKNEGYTIDFAIYSLKNIVNITKYKKYAKKKT